MIFNISRLHQFQECRRKAQYADIDRLIPNREEEALMIGSGFHGGAASILAGKPLEEAKRDAEAAYRERQAKDLLPEEQAQHEHNVTLVNCMVEKFHRKYKDDPYTVLHPEVEFCVPMPGTIHHCYFAHQMLGKETNCNAQMSGKGGYFLCDCGYATVQEALLLDRSCGNCGEQIPLCFQPHWFKGKTDAIIMLRNVIWLLEHKTTALAYSLYVRQFQLADQPTGYIYGIWKSIGLKPHGFILNVIQKPNKRVREINPFNIEIDREPFLRTDEDLARFEREAIQLATDYEHAVVEKAMYMNTSSCHNWNRACYFLDVCLNHGEIREDQFIRRDDDYVLDEYKKILHMEVK